MELLDENKSKPIALKVENDIIDESTNNEDVDEDEIDLVIRKFRKFFKSKRSKISESMSDSSSKNTRTREQPGYKVARFQRELENQ